MIAVLVGLLTLVATAGAPAGTPAGQAGREARLAVTVVDQTQGAIPNATVTVTPLTDPKNAPAPAQTSYKGIASLTGLAPGRYSIQAEFPGFEPRILKDVTIRPGDNKHVVVLALQGLQDSVTVSRDAREAASDRRSTFGTALTREQIEALSDDPDEMAQQLQDMAGGNATIRVDSFEGGRLPPKSAIKAIHITRDAFAAENHFAGGLFIDIITQPGIGPLRTGVNMRLRDGSMSGTPPAQFAHEKGPERFQNYSGNFGGSLIKQKASFSISVQGGTSYDTPYFYYTTPDLEKVNTLAPRSPRDNVFVFGLFDYAITRDQTLRVNYSQEQFTSKSLGIGGYELTDRGYSTDQGNHTLRIQEAGPLGRRFFTNTRASINWSSNSASSFVELPTVRVIEAFTGGGQQRKGGVRSKSLNLQSDLDYVRGIHSVRTGVQFDGGTYHSDSAQDYLGTYTFESMNAYLNGRPRSYTRRIGDPNINYWNLQAGAYLQDDIRVRRNLTLSPGIRYEAQTHLSDLNNFGPRFGVTWSPGQAGKMTLRASAGIFYEWLSTGIYEQTLRVDGERQKEVNINNPSYPDPGTGGGVTPPTQRYQLNDDLQMQRFTRVSAGIDRGLGKMLRVNATYAHTSGDNLMRGFNLNPVVNGVRLDPNFANIVEVLDDAESRQHTLNIGATLNFNVSTPGPVMINGGMIMIAGGGPPPPPPPPGQRPTPANARWNWRRMSVFTNTFFGRNLNNTDGAFSMPATGFIRDDWGPAGFDVRRRFNVGWSSQQLRNMNMNLNLNVGSASPYTIRTGFDTNGDLAFTDRPAGIGRNSARGSGQYTLNGNFGYGWTFGKQVERGGGISLRGDGGAISVSQMGSQSQGKYRLQLSCNIQNLTNHGNLIGYTGTLTSVDFGKPTGVSGTRKVDISLGLSF